jgi:hypothetical protein
MLHDQHRMIRRAKCLLFGFGQCVESVSDHGNCKPAAFLKLD